MTGEEKEAIGWLSALDIKSEYEATNKEIILNLIENQQKEIEEYNTKILSNAGIYQLGFKDGQKSVEDKIKAKIEELDEEIKVKREIAKNSMDRVSGRLLIDSIVELEKTKKVLQSLLEKE